MKRLHVHLDVADIDRSIVFYSALFDAQPTLRKSDYARWKIDDPHMNFAISSRCGEGGGVSHLGIQVEDDEELGAVERRLAAAQGPVHEEGETTCCYARSRKSWISDPDGIAWEAFLTHGDAAEFGTNPDLSSLSGVSASESTVSDSPCCGSAQ